MLAGVSRRVAVWAASDLQRLPDMAMLIHRFSTSLKRGDVVYFAEAWGEQRADGLWSGWIEFSLPGGDGAVLGTARETTQSNLDTLTYWATGLEPVYLDGALTRAIEKAPNAA